MLSALHQPDCNASSTVFWSSLCLGEDFSDADLQLQHEHLCMRLLQHDILHVMV